MPTPTPEADDLFSFLVHVLVHDVLLDLDDDDHDVREYQNPTIACQARGDDLGSTTCDRSDAAPRKSP